MQYRAEIDGLRAIAVIPVVLFHAGFSYFSGGYIGVDIFFVISGYLITTILIHEMENNRFSLFNFYERRARRILPALYIVLLSCLPFAWVLMVPYQFKDFSQSLAATTLFASNFLFWLETGYFDTAAYQKPLLHTWSLAVEEQFYILYPIILLAIYRYGFRVILLFFVGLSVLGLLLSEWGWRNITSANFYFMPMRAWEFFLGGISAIIVYKKGVIKNQFYPILGLSLVLGPIFIYEDGTPTPSVYNLIPVFGVLLIIVFAEKETYISRLLSLKPFVAIGLISYSAYLWHQPIFAFARISNIFHLSNQILIFLSLSSFVLAAITWKFVEQPFRDKKNRAYLKKNGIKLFASVNLILLILGVVGHFYSNQINQYRFKAKPDVLLTERLIVHARNNNPVFNFRSRYDDGLCRFSVSNLDINTEKRILSCREKFGAGLLVFGDSHATNLFHTLVRNKYNDSRPFIVGITKNGCHLPELSNTCQYSNLLNFTRNYRGVFQMAIYEKAGFLMLDFDGEKENLRLDETKVATIKVDVVEGVIRYLSDLNKHVDVLWFGPRVEPFISELELYNLTCSGDFSLRPNHVESFERLDGFLESRVHGLNFDYLSQIFVYDFSFPDDYGSCEKLYWFDRSHMSIEGEVRFGEKFNILDLLQ